MIQAYWEIHTPQFGEANTLLSFRLLNSITGLLATDARSAREVQDGELLVATVQSLSKVIKGQNAENEHIEAELKANYSTMAA